MAFGEAKSLTLHWVPSKTRGLPIRDTAESRSRAFRGRFETVAGRFETVRFET